MNSPEAVKLLEEGGPIALGILTEHGLSGPHCLAAP